ncbi:type 1 fimbrial protein [Cronobacter turicensis]|uniref:fimbrial protein n=1 Tax=Cronobacter turicensis TaxID=413502 RepID=UPI00141310E7|nr:fimbrial protein [Cronobacter turicensis]NHV10875.1 type 1 fimbrial protein [Cronobacter turicensis]NHV64897.1 type 1 fimbrial protein [Cronobacter turicensis]NHW11838.1 type 1 fimbrial protein [Cronobacter turicensis]
MKMYLPAFSIVALFLSAAACAENTAPDVSATLQISGTATQMSGCAVVLSKQSVALTSNTSSLIIQGGNANAAEMVAVNLTGASGQASEACDEEMNQGHLAVTFNGQADDVHGTVLANTDTSGGAASGVGIGVFNHLNQPVSVNGGIIHLDKISAESSAAEFGVQMVKLQNKTVKAGNVLGSMTVQISHL